MRSSSRRLLAMSTLCLAVLAACQKPADSADTAASETAAPQVPTAATGEAPAPEALDNAFDIELGDASIHVQAESCEKNINLITCENVELAVAVPGREPQTLKLPEVLFPAGSDDGSLADTAIRGSLEGGFADGQRSLMLSDVNLDGEEDLVAWSGRNGSYGDPSYTWFIYDPEAKQLVENTALAEMIDGHSLSRVEGNRLFVWYRSGACERGEKEVELNGNTPTIAKRDDYNTCEGEQPLDWRPAALPEAEVPSGELGPQTKLNKRGSQMFNDCVNEAAGDATKTRECFIEEIDYRSEGTSSEYDEIWEKSNPASVNSAITARSKWQKDSVSYCASDIEGASPSELLCLLDRELSLTRFAIYSSGSEAPKYWSTSEISEDEIFHANLGEISVDMNAQRCISRHDFTSCLDVELKVSIPGLDKQSINIPELRFPAPGSENNFTANAYRGPLAAQFANGMYGVMVSDLNEDRIEDLLVWSGNDGHAGAPSYTWFLSDRNTGRLVENTRMSEILKGHSVSAIEESVVHAWYRNDRCIRGDKMISIYDDGPRITTRHDYDDCKAPAAAAAAAAEH